MNKADMLQKLNALRLDKRNYWLITGGAMVLYGIKAETDDLDLGCTAALADELEQRGCPVARLHDGTRRIDLAPGVELFENWLFDRVETVDTIPVISLRGLLAMKKDLGREKDLADIKRIEAFLAAGGRPKY